MKILYLSCHSILEFDEVKLLHEMGHKVFSPGAYVEPDNPGDASLRPAIKGLVYEPEVLSAWHKLAGAHPGLDTKEFLSKEFVDLFDCVIVMHMPKWIYKNWEAMKHKRVIWRTIGQSLPNIEQQMLKYRREGMQIVRYSPMERSLHVFSGEDALIRFYKDPEDYGNWTGGNERVVTFAQSMEQRGRACGFNIFEQSTRGLDRQLFGPGNGHHSFGTDKVPFEQLQQEMRENRVYFYTGTHPASYTLNFIEAWMTGIPIVAVGKKYGDASYFPGIKLYEVDELIEHGKTGFIANSPEELKSHVKFLFDHPEEAKKISIAARNAAIATFGKETIREQWTNFLGG